MTLSEDLSRQLVEFKEKNHLQTRQIAQLTGVRENSISCFLHGHRRLDPDNTLAIAKLLDMPKRQLKKELAWVAGQSGKDPNGSDSVPTGVVRKPTQKPDSYIPGGQGVDPDKDENVDLPTGVKKKTDSAEVDDDPLARLLEVYAAMDDLFEKGRALRQLITVPGTNNVKA